MHALLPTLCPDCLALAIEDAAEPGAYVFRACEHREAYAIGYKRGGNSIVAWELHTLTDSEAKLHGPQLLELFATRQVAMRRRPKRDGRADCG
jgi:hypothetical protein